MDTCKVKSVMIFVKGICLEQQRRKVAIYFQNNPVYLDTCAQVLTYHLMNVDHDFICAISPAHIVLLNWFWIPSFCRQDFG